VLTKQELRSFHDLMKNYAENVVIFSIYSVSSALTKRAYRWMRKSHQVMIPKTTDPLNCDAPQSIF